MVHNTTGKPLRPVRREEGKAIGQAAYACYVVLFSAVYFAFFMYCNRYLDVIVDDIIHFRFSDPTKMAAILSVACICVWVLFFAATVWRGRDIGFAKWQSVILYLIPSMPRTIEMLVAFDWSHHWIEPLATVLCLVISIVFLYLPSGWYLQRQKGRS